MAEQALGLWFLDEIDLIGNYDGWDFLRFGDYKETIQHAQARRRVCAGEDEQSLVRVGEDDLLVEALRAGVAADEGALARLDALDHWLVARGPRDINPIAEADDVAFGAALLETAAEARGHGSGFGLDLIEAGL
jgi:hypothetical protein